ncbi:MAG: ABC transporter permease [Anaerolineales bacterium]|jgi:peptide/nickel transport system permease protein|nr:ABC transporter permease [Anaerolineales bacterium]
MNTIKKAFSSLLQYPSAIAGLIVVLVLIIASIYVVITIPYSTAISLWRGGEEVWYKNPKYAPPAWFNNFTEKKLAESFSMTSADPDVVREVIPGDKGTSRINLTYTFDYDFDVFPQEMLLYFNSTFESKQPFVSIVLITPDQREIRVSDFGVANKVTYRFSQDEKLIRRLGGVSPVEGLFANLDAEGPLVPVKGTYQLVLKGVTFEEGSDIDAEFVFHGQVYGLAGTDHARRDLTLPLMWGIPVALAFGLIASLGTSVLTMIIAAIGAWYGGWVDELIQRITEVNLVLPFLPILIMVGTFYSRSIWVILGATILLSIFTASIKSYRAIFLQTRESTYIEAARAYGASDARIIFLYLIPRMIPLLIPGLVSSVPAFVFLEASLAVLGLGDPVLPTWGKIINDAQNNGALYKGYYYWILEPAVLLMVTGLGFAMLGFALDRIFNPRLRGM